MGGLLYINCWTVRTDPIGAQLLQQERAYCRKYEHRLRPGCLTERQGQNGRSGFALHG